MPCVDVLKNSENGKKSWKLKENADNVGKQL